MRGKWLVLAGAVLAPNALSHAVTVITGTGTASLTLELERNASPAPGLTSYTLSIVSPNPGQFVNAWGGTFSGVNNLLTGGLQITPTLTNASTLGGLQSQDSHFLYNDGELVIVTMTETSGSNSSIVSDFTFASTPATLSVPLAQLVVPTGQQFTINGQGVVVAPGQPFTNFNTTLTAVRNMVWNGNAGNWETTNNWLDPADQASWDSVSPDNAVFAANPGLTSVNLGSSQTAGSVTFNSGAPVYTITGSTLNLKSSAGVLIAANASANFNNVVNVQAAGSINVANGNTLSLAGGLTSASLITKTGNGTLTLAGAQTHSSGSTLKVDAGTVNLNTNAGGNLALQINNNAQVNASATQTLASLLITGTAKLNLQTNDVLIDYTGGSPYTTIKGYVAGGKVFSSSSIPAGVGSTGIGYGEATEVDYAGEPDATSVILKYTYKGDANLDGQVDVTDLGRLATNWQTSGDWVDGDFDYSGFIDVTDLGVLATNWQQGVGSPLSLSFSEAMALFPQFGGVSIPEPASLGLLAFGAMGMMRRRRSR